MLILGLWDKDGLGRMNNCQGSDLGTLVKIMPAGMSTQSFMEESFSEKQDFSSQRLAGSALGIHFPLILI